MWATLSYFACFALGARSVVGVAVWGQCGGIGYTGSTVCENSVCVKSNDWYSQCLPGTAGSTSTSITTTFTTVPVTTVVTTTTTSSRTTTSSGPVPTGGANIPRGVLTQLTDFGSNPTNVEVYAYVPTTLKPNPALLAALHWCGGSAQAYYSGTQYKSFADQYGFIILYPTAPDGTKCWDVHTNETLTHNAGGDSLGIVNGMRYLISQFSVDPAKVFATGTSSGGMMTNALAGAYPDLIRGGAAFAGIPYGCFAGPTMWNGECSTGQLIKTPQEWGDLARSGYPGYTGPRPKMQLWHGSNDTGVHTQNFYEAIKQWTNVFGVSQTPTATTQNWPLTNWIRTDYGPNVQAIIANGIGHDIPVQETRVIEWLGLNQ